MSTDTSFRDLVHSLPTEGPVPPDLLQHDGSQRCRNIFVQGRHETRSPACIATSMDYIFHRCSQSLPEKLSVVRLSHAVSRAVFEIIAGYRSVTQLKFIMTNDCICKLRNQALLETDGYKLAPEPGTTHGQVQSMRLRATLGGAWECTVILGFKYRVRAVALRIEPWHGRWQVTGLEML